MPEQPSLFAPPARDPPAAKGSPTSRAAARSMKRVAPQQRGVVLEWVRQQGRFGTTCDEIEAQFVMRHQSAAARLWELERMGKVRKTAQRRETRSGRNAAVYVAILP